MTIENKLGITDATELARQEERLTKRRAKNYLKAENLKNLKWALFEV
ncbi:MAG: hypothetical protein LBI43_06190 [Streptococcaceae bacterium]|jgi:hypothetical protein|nr:hypothetical protein [Streptococcaceae bacterium]